MPAYAIGRVHIRDRSWMKEYSEKIGPLLAEHGGSYLVGTDTMETIEGDAPHPSVMIVLEFPSMENARAWYNDDEYMPLIKLRQTGADLDLVLVEGSASH